jgi:hypothetical protein
MVVGAIANKSGWWVDVRRGETSGRSFSAAVTEEEE